MVKRKSDAKAVGLGSLALRDRVKQCAKFGGGTGLVLTVYALVLLVARGNDAAAGVPAWVLIPAYPFFGVVAGAVVGALLPIGRSYFGSVVIGIVAAVIPVAGLSAGMYGFAWNRAYLLPVVVTSVLLGGLTGIFWRTAHGPPRS